MNWKTLTIFPWIFLIIFVIFFLDKSPSNGFAHLLIILLIFVAIILSLILFLIGSLIEKNKKKEEYSVGIKSLFFGFIIGSILFLVTSFGWIPLAILYRIAYPFFGVYNSSGIAGYLFHLSTNFIFYSAIAFIFLKIKSKFS